MALILVADDEKNVRLSLKYLLEDLGYAVIEAEDGEAALELAAQEHPDVILLDVWLPDLDGFHVLRALRQNKTTKELPVILLTGMAAIEGEQAAFDLGVTHYITKPWEPSALESAIKVALREATTAAAEAIPGQDSIDLPPSRPDSRRSITVDDVRDQANSFLKRALRNVRGFRITGIQSNVRNPQKEMWGTWGTRMIKVFGDADLSAYQRSSARSVSFAISIYVSKDGTKVARAGQVYDKVNPAAVSFSDKQYAAELRRRNSPKNPHTKT